MCGILGIALRPAKTVGMTPEVFRSALQKLHHRGPDGSGVYRDGHVWLGHTRLSILDLTSAGAQPMQTEDGRYTITYNGEIYNYQRLAAELRLQGLRSNSDTEVVLRMFAAQGPAGFPKLNGMFAFCVYDRHAQKLWLVRDRIGIKPLYFRHDSSGLVFSSEIKGIVALSATAPVCNVAAVHEWLYYGNALGGRTLHSGVRQLLPGHYLELDLNSSQIQIREYHTFKGQGRSASDQSGVDTGLPANVSRLLEEAVRRQLVSDVPVGVFLSGGIDSSAIAAFASRHYQGRLATYSVGFDFSSGSNELPNAKRFAAQLGTNHHEIHISGADVASIVERLVHHHDAPFADAANIPLYMMAQRISSDTKVVLQGDGGDELFGGYRRYSTMRHYRLLRFLAQALGGVNDMMPETPLFYRMQRYLHALSAGDLASTMARLLTQEDPQWRPVALFGAGMADAIARFDPFARFREVQPRFEDQDVVNQMSLTDICIELPDRFLEKVDRSTMAASLEVRVPFLDNDLVDYTIGLSGESKMPFGKRKWLLKKALKNVIPEETLRGPKVGLTVPYGAWLQTSLKPLFFDHLSTLRSSHPGLLNTEHVEKLFARTGARKQNHSFMLWKTLNFMIWANNTKMNFDDQSIS